MDPEKTIYLRIFGGWISNCAGSRNKPESHINRVKMKLLRKGKPKIGKSIRSEKIDKSQHFLNVEKIC